MLVAVRASACQCYPHALYNLSTSENNVLIEAACSSSPNSVLSKKSFQCDLFAASNEEIFIGIIQPLLHIVTIPNKAKQAVVVLNGSSECLKDVLGEHNGVLHACCQYLFSPQCKVKHVQASVVSISQDGRKMRDALSKSESHPADSLSIYEDIESQVTHIEGHIESISLNAFQDVDTLCSAALVFKGGVSIISLFLEVEHCTPSHFHVVCVPVDAANGIPSPVMEDLSRVGCALVDPSSSVSASVRVVTSTALTKFIYPALVGNQPGAWISCFNLVSSSGKSETFEAASAIASLAQNIYFSRLRRFHYASTVSPSPVPAPAAEMIDLPATLRTPIGELSVSSRLQKRDAETISRSMEGADSSERVCQCAKEWESYKRGVDAAVVALKDEVSSYVAQLKETKEQLIESMQDQDPYSFMGGPGFSGRGGSHNAFDREKNPRRRIFDDSLSSSFEEAGNLRPSVTVTKGFKPLNAQQRKASLSKLLSATPTTQRCGFDIPLSKGGDECLQGTRLTRLKYGAQERVVEGTPGCSSPSPSFTSSAVGPTRSRRSTSPLPVERVSWCELDGTVEKKEDTTCRNGKNYAKIPLSNILSLLSKPYDLHWNAENRCERGNNEEAVSNTPVSHFPLWKQPLNSAVPHADSKSQFNFLFSEENLGKPSKMKFDRYRTASESTSGSMSYEEFLLREPCFQLKLSTLVRKS